MGVGIEASHQRAERAGRGSRNGRISGRDEHRQPAFVEGRPRTQVEPFRHVFVVTDEDERRAHDVRRAVHDQLSGNGAVVAPGPQHRDRERHRFPTTAALLGVALPHHARINAEAGVVHENPPVHLAHVDHLHVAGDDRFDRGGGIERNAKVLGKVVERAGGNHAERGAGFDRNRGNRIHCPVPSRSDQGVAAAGRLSRARRQVSAVANALEAYLRPLRLEQSFELRARVVPGRAS